MKIYQYDHAVRLKEFDEWLGDYRNWDQIASNSRGRYPSLFLPYTEELKCRIEKANILAALKGIKIVKPVYRDYYKNKDGRICV